MISVPNFSEQILNAVRVKSLRQNTSYIMITFDLDL